MCAAKKEFIIALDEGTTNAKAVVLDAQGNVGPIGGIQQKLYGAKKAGATYFLAPAGNCDEVVGHVPAGLQVYSVETLNDALNVLSFVEMHGEKSEAMNAKMGMLATCQN